MPSPSTSDAWLAPLRDRLATGTPAQKLTILDAAAQFQTLEGAELTGEGANRYTPKQKRQRFTEARGEAGEVACHMERAYSYRLVSERELEAVLSRADRVCAMLTGLIRRHS